MLNLTILTFFLFSILSVISSSRTPDAGLRQELIDSIKEIQHNGEPKEFDSSLRDLLAQLEKYQMDTPHAVQMDWDVADISASTNSKSVCMVVSSFEGMYINSGIGTAYYALANLLVSQGHKVTVIYTRDEATRGGSWDEWVAYHKTKGITLLSLPLSSIPLHMTSLQATSLRVYRYLVSLPAFDIVHFADFEGHGFYPTLAKKVSTQFFTTSFVVGLHGPSRWVIESNSARIPTTETEIDTDWMERMSVENADAVWTPSAYMASWMSVQGWTLPASAHLLPLAPGPEFRGIISTITTVQPKEFVYFGRLEVRKGLVLFCVALDLFAKIYHTLDKEISVTFLGRSGLVNGVEGSDYVAQRAGKWPFSVKMISDSDRKTALEYLMDASSPRVAVIPSLADNAPYTVYECLYAGIPFLASSIPSISPLFADDYERSAHLFEVKPHHIVSKMAGAVRNGLSSATPTFTVSQAESVWTTFYAQVQPKAPIMTTADMPLVSVIITHYNRPELVKQAIASVESQSYSNIEVVLVDDGSTQESARVYLDSMESYFQEKNWKIIRGINKYLGAARNTGAKAAQGKYLLFLDDDNTFAATAVASYVMAAKLSGAGIVTAGHAVFTGTSAPSSESVIRHWLPLGASLTAGLFKNTFGDANFFVLRSKFMLVGGFTEDRGVGLEEHEFFAKSIFNGTKLEVIPEILLYYRQHSENDQMLYTTDLRLGEARRLRPYLSALGESVDKTSETHQSNRRSLVNLVARNAASPRSTMCNATVTAITPSSGPYPGGNQVTISGAGFLCAGITKVRIGPNDCTAVDIPNDTTLTCTVPQGANIGTYPVVVTAGTDVTLASGYTYTPTPAPLGLGATIDATGKITVKFSVPTDQGGAKRTDAFCARLLDSSTVGLIGSSTCSFSDASTLIIQLSDDATLSAGDNVTIPEGKIRGLGPNGAPNARISVTVQLTSDINTMNPVVNIATRDVGSCEGITLNATGSIGSGGRKFTHVLWTLADDAPRATAASIAAIRTVLANASTYRDLVVVLPAGIVTSGASYRFNLKLTNWFGQSDQTEAPVNKLAAAIPIVSIDPSQVASIYTTESKSYTGVYSGLACSNQTSGAASFQWTISPPPPAGYAVTLNTQNLNLPAGLLAGTTYSINFTVTDIGSGLSNTATVQLIIVPRDILAKLIGGGSVQFNKTVTLDASGSTDPEGSALSYSWSCTSSSGAPCSKTFTSDAAQTFNSADLGVGTFTITVTVSGTISGRSSATASVSLTVTQLPVLQIHINAAYTAYAVSSPITLYGIIDNTNVALSEISWIWTTTATITGSPYPNGVNRQNLDIAANTLTAGRDYTFTLTATHSSGISGTASITITILAVTPSNSTVCAVPRSGQSYSTLESFSFGSVWQWAAGVNRFQVFYSFAGSSIVYPATAPRDTYNFSIPLPVGSLKITGTATSSTGLITTLGCSANVAAGDLATISADARVATDSYNLARITFSLQNSRPASATTPTAFLTGRANILTRSLVFAVDALQTEFNPDQALLLTTVVQKILDPSVGQLNSVEIIAAGSLTFALFTAVGESSQLTDLEALSAYNTVQDASDKLATQITRALTGAVRRNVMDELDDLNAQTAQTNAATSNVTTNPWASVTTVEQAKSAQAIMAAAIRTQMLSRLPLGLILTVFTDSTIKTLYKDSPSVIDGTGASMGVNSTIITPTGIVPTNRLGDDSITLVYLESRDSVYDIPAGWRLASAVFNLYGIDASLNDFNFTQEPVSVVIPDNVLATSNGSNSCAMYVNGNWTANGVRTDRTVDNRTLCTFPGIATFALLNNPSGTLPDQVLTTTNNNASSDIGGGLSGGAIAGIVIGAVVLVAVIAVGSAIGVKKHRDNAAIAQHRPNLRSGDSGAGGVAIDPPLDPIFVPAYMGPMYVPPAQGSAGPVYLNRSALVPQSQVSPVIYGTFQQPPVEQPIAPVPVVPAAVARRDARNDDFSSDSESDTRDSSSATSRSSRYSRRDSDDDTLSSEIHEIAGELSRQMPRGQEDRDDLSNRMDLNM